MITELLGRIGEPESLINMFSSQTRLDEHVFIYILCIGTRIANTGGATVETHSSLLNSAPLYRPVQCNHNKSSIHSLLAIR